MKRIITIASLSIFGCVGSATNSFVFSQTDVKPASETLKSPAFAEPKPAESINLSTQANNLFLKQWVRIDKDRNIRGSAVSLVGNDTVSLQKVRVSLMQSGNIVLFDDTDVDGEFLLEDVSPGVYTLVAETANSMSVFSLAVLDKLAGKHLPNDVEVRLMNTEGGRTAEIIRGQTIPKKTTYELPSQDPLQANRQTSDSHQVAIDAAGTLKGQLSKTLDQVDMSSMYVYVMKDGVEVKREKVASDGKFTVRGLLAGCYGLVAAGDQGIAVTAFCATNRDLALRSSKLEKLVGLSEKISSSLNIELGDSISKETTKKPENDVAKSDNPFPMSPPGMGPGFAGGSMMGGGSGGGGNGGFGGGGVGGRLAGIAGVGGLIAVTAVIASRNNNQTTIVSPVVP